MNKEAWNAIAEAILTRRSAEEIKALVQAIFDDGYCQGHDAGYAECLLNESGAGI